MKTTPGNKAHNGMFLSAISTAQGNDDCQQPPHHQLFPSQQEQSPSLLMSPCGGDVTAVESLLLFDNASWDARFEELRTFYRINGHCNVPAVSSSSSPYAGLSCWVRQQRREYAVYHASGKQPYSALHAMTPTRLVKLMMINFSWEQPPEIDDHGNYDYAHDGENHNDSLAALCNTKVEKNFPPPTTILSSACESRQDEQQQEEKTTSMEESVDHGGFASHTEEVGVDKAGHLDHTLANRRRRSKPRIHRDTRHTISKKRKLSSLPGRRHETDVFLGDKRKDSDKTKVTKRKGNGRGSSTSYYTEEFDAEAARLAQSLLVDHRRAGVTTVAQLLDENTTMRSKLSMPGASHATGGALLDKKEGKHKTKDINGNGKISASPLPPREKGESDASKKRGRISSITPTEQQDRTAGGNDGTGGVPIKNRRKLGRPWPPERASLQLAELPKDYVPGPWTIVIGRDKAAIEATGNKRLRVLGNIYLTKYSSSTCKEDKTNIITEIEETIRSACGEKEGDNKPVGSFVKFMDGRWWEVDAWVGREKIGRMLREPLFLKYTSTSRFKRARFYLKRNQKREAAMEKKQLKDGAARVRV